MKKELTREELKEYIKKHGETEVELTEDYDESGHKKGDKVSFEADDVGDDVYDPYEVHTVEGVYWFDGYKGKFILTLPDTGFLIDSYEWLEVGALVDVHELGNYLAGLKGCKILYKDEVEGSYKVETEDGNDRYWVSALYVKPHVPEEKDATQEAIELLKSQGFKIVKE